jgi:pimeloyl-ACP methyl ester carboxylesterase
MRRMPVFERDGVVLHYLEQGQGFPLLLFAPGGMRSAIEFWERAPWNPITALERSFRVIAMDQRNAGGSSAPVRDGDGWHNYTEDHLALLDHLGLQRCHLLGGCIGSSYCLSLIQAAPERVAAAVLQNPIGLHENREAFYSMFDGWAVDQQQRQPGLQASTCSALRERMFGGDFVFSVSREFVRACSTPLLILAGSDLYHPTPISRELAALAPNAELVEGWKSPQLLPGVADRVRQFLERNS